jgi:hypothetical protein
MLFSWLEKHAMRLKPASFIADRCGNFAVYTAIMLLPISIVVAMSIEYASALNYRSNLQQLLDAAVLAGAREDSDQVGAAATFFEASLPIYVNSGEKPAATFNLGTGVLNGAATGHMPHKIGAGFLGKSATIGVASQARFEKPVDSGPCVTVLANKGQALLVNSGADVAAPACEMHVHSQQDPAFIMNAGSTLNLKRLCVKGMKYIKNGGTISKLETGCAVAADPYFGTIPEPSVPATCTTSGARDGATHTLNPGVHCSVNFNGTPTITFKPGLHIIKGPMIINSGATVNAEGVTFYFPNTDSQIQANGGLTIKATAPTTGTHKGILMFEKVSDAANNANKRQLVFNGSKGEYLEGVIHLPNRDVTYNSTTNITGNKTTLVVHTLIINSANWKLEGGSGGGQKTVYLSR